MKLALTILTTGLILLTPAFSADEPAKEDKRAAKVEDRMKEEKLRDERNAKEFANRVRVARFDSVWRSPRNLDIDVVQGGEVIQKPYKIIALLTFDCAVNDETQAVSGFIEMAKALGADGAALLGYEIASLNPRSPSLLSPSDKRVFRANAFVYQTSK
jgi:hypothetical protein